MSSVPKPPPDTLEPPPEEFVSEARAVGLSNFSFNFTLDRTARLRSFMGAPAFALRRRRLDRNLERFWKRVAARYDALWKAAGEGRIDENGREVRAALLDADGRDPLARLEHRKELHRRKIDEEDDQVRAFNSAWQNYLENLDLGGVEAEVEAYNRYFPIEANLATDPETGHFLWKGGRWEGLEAPEASDILERFPLR
ncbi:MAG: hypothetical protein VX498_02765 [Myxococcota bacterium]|nr:hypothetical protein [Myxococcota bacterium]